MYVCICVYIYIYIYIYIKVNQIKVNQGELKSQQEFSKKEE